MKKNKLNFIRMSGTENTFWFADTFDNKDLSTAEKKKIARRLCEGYFGLKTDGLIFLRKAKGYDFGWDFYNSDGSDAEMCGNAARCATKFYFEKVKPKKKISFETTAGKILGEVIKNDKVKILMTKISSVQQMTVLDKKGIFVNTGVPHFVIEQEPDAFLAKKLRKVSNFGKAGANITFVDKLKGNSLKAVTFERGVEGFTQACGTGAVAAAMYLQHQAGPQKTVIVSMPGGNLTIENAAAGKQPSLIGAVKFELSMTELGENT